MRSGRGRAAYCATVADHRASVHWQMNVSHIVAQAWKKMRQSQCLTPSLFLLPSSPGTTALDTHPPVWESRSCWQRNSRAAAATAAPRLRWPRSQIIITVIPNPIIFNTVYDTFQKEITWLSNVWWNINVPLNPFLLVLHVGRNYGCAAGAQPEGTMYNYWITVCRHRWTKMQLYWVGREPQVPKIKSNFCPSKSAFLEESWHGRNLSKGTKKALFHCLMRDRSLRGVDHWLRKRTVT